MTNAPVTDDLAPPQPTDRLLTRSQVPPLVSVIIPCYAQGHFLRAAIDSVFAQTMQQFEIIVINDDSPDTPLIEEIVREFGAALTYIHQANAGLSAARNAGLAVARGDFIVCLDSDDRLLPTALQTGLDAFDTRPNDGLVWGFSRFIDASGELLDGREEGGSTDGSYAALLVENTIGPPVGVMFRRSMLMAAGAFSTDLRHSEDYEAYLRIVRLHGAFCHRQFVAEYRLHGANMSYNSAGMLVGCLTALSLQRQWVATDPVLRRALRKGVRSAWEMYDAEPRIQRLKQQLVSRQLSGAAVSCVAILARYPRKFLRVTYRALRKLTRTDATPGVAAIR